MRRLVMIRKRSLMIMGVLHMDGSLLAPLAHLVSTIALVSAYSRHPCLTLYVVGTARRRRTLALYRRLMNFAVACWVRGTRYSKAVSYRSGSI